MTDAAIIESLENAKFVHVDGYVLSVLSMVNEASWKCKFPSGSTVSGFAWTIEQARERAVKAMNDHKAM